MVEQSEVEDEVEGRLELGPHGPGGEVFEILADIRGG